MDCNTDEKVSAAIISAVNNGCEVVFTTSLSELPETMRMAVKYPEIRFYSCAVNQPSSIVRYYYGRLFEAKYLMGMLAAMLADNHKIGYLDNYPLCGSLANLNAFALGAAGIDPQAEIHAIWLKEKGHENWKQYMQDRDIRIISGHDIAEPLDDNTEYGVFRIAEDGSIINYGAAVWNSGNYYRQILEPIIQGYETDDDVRKDQTLLLWWGMAQDVIDINLSSQISPYTRKTIEFCRRMIKEGNLNPFSGRLDSQEGMVQDQDAVNMSGEKIITMDWLNYNIVTPLPKQEDFDEGSRKLFELCGIGK
jgi:basic membrane lipoprotein Med (substrate-binding protein (PBP1-ABC) superfamily)